MNSKEKSPKESKIPMHSALYTLRREHVSVHTTPRLLCAADTVRAARILCDVGCDHGYLPVYLLKSGKIDFAYACDINRGPLIAAKRNVERFSLENRVEFRQGGGLSPVRGEKPAFWKNAVITICGMGGRLIAEILNDDLEIAGNAGQLVLQPMRDAGFLRRYLKNNGFNIVNERLAREKNRFYNILDAAPGEYEVSGGFGEEFDFEIGGRAVVNNDPLVFEYLENKKRILRKILNAKSGKEDVSGLNMILAEIEKIKKTYNLQKKCKKNCEKA